MNCCESFKLSVMQNAFFKTSGIEMMEGNWKCDVYLDHKLGDKLYPTMFNEKGEPQLYQYEDRSILIMKFCPYCGAKLDNQ